MQYRPGKSALKSYTPALLASAALLAALSVLCVAGLGCNKDAPTIAESFNQAEFFVGAPDEADSRRQALIADILAAKNTVDIAVSRLENVEVAQALVDAHNAGVQVRVVSDWDSWADGSGADAGLQLLEDAGIEPTYGDGALSYLPEPNLASILGSCRPRPENFLDCTRGQGQGTMLRPGDYNLMSHNFAIIDEHTVWNFPALVEAEQPWLGWRIESSVLAYDFLHEFQQMHGGVFSTTLDVYNGPVKSTTDSNVSYFTDQGQMRLWFNPQERLLKEIIDQVYKAKASVWVMSDNLVNPDLLDALEYKHAHGFDVRIMVHPDHQLGGDARVRLDAMQAKAAPAGVEHLPTMLVIDQQPDRNNDKRPRSVLVLSHPLIRASPYEVVPSNPADSVYVYPSDLFVDGNLWQLLETGATVHQDALLNRYINYWLKLWNQ